MYPFWDLCVEIYPKLDPWTILHFHDSGGFWLLDVCSSFNRDYPLGKYVVMVLVLTVLSPLRSIHDQWTRFLNYWLVAITLHYNSSTAIMAVPPNWNGTSAVATRLYLLIINLVFTHSSTLIYIFSFMGILLQLIFTSESHRIYISSLIMVFIKVYNLCWIGWSDAFPILPIFKTWYQYFPNSSSLLVGDPTHLEDSYLDS